jgi:hypothetical protein
MPSPTAWIGMNLETRRADISGFRRTATPLHVAACSVHCSQATMLRRPVALTPNQRRTLAVVASGSTVTLFAAVVGAALAVAGLAGNDPQTLAALAVLAAGFALGVQGLVVASRWPVATRIVGRERLDVFSMSVEMVGGGVTVLLAALALLGAAPITLLCAATVVLGASVCCAAPMQPDLAELGPSLSSRPPVTRGNERAARTAMAGVGIAALLAGVLAAATVVPPLPFLLAASLLLAAAITLAGGSLAARFRRLVV